LYIATGRERKAADTAAQNKAAASARLLGLAVALSVCCIGGVAASLQMALNLIPASSLGQAIVLQMRKRQLAARRLAGLAFALAVGIAMSGAGLCIDLPACPPSGTLHTARERMRQKLQTETGKAVYARRKAIVEAPFGTLKEAQGMRRFLVRGLQKVQGEWNLATACYNIRKMFRYGKQAVLGAVNGASERVAAAR
jgi:hypothetical protein